MMNFHSFLAMPWVVPVICGSLVAIIAIVSNVISDCIKCRADSNLKETMVEHGYSAEQIHEILSLKPSSKPHAKGGRDATGAWS